MGKEAERMTSFTDKDIEGLKQCPVCEMWSNLGFCWKCEPYKLVPADSGSGGEF